MDPGIWPAIKGCPSLNDKNSFYQPVNWVWQIKPHLTSPTLGCIMFWWKTRLVWMQKLYAPSDAYAKTWISKSFTPINLPYKLGNIILPQPSKLKNYLTPLRLKLIDKNRSQEVLNKYTFWNRQLNETRNGLLSSGESYNGVIRLNRSNNSVFLYLKIYWKRQVFDLIRASWNWMKPETLCHQTSSSKF